jgi:hypothetical protein
MNKFKVRCPGCDGIYSHAVIEGFSKLLHPGVTWGALNIKLPTKNCVASIDYVYFEDCRHCCPERFAECPECPSGEIGVPTTRPCRSDE